MMRKALTIGATVAILDYLWLTLSHYQAHDFTWPWHAARMLMEGHSPYAGFTLPGGPAFADPFFYPLPAALLAVPFAPLPSEVAGALWASLGAALLSCVLPWPALLSACAVIAFRNAQWAPMLIGSALLSPYALGLAAAKPTIGLALWAYKPSWKGATLAAALLLLSFLILPSWLSGWLANAGAGGHRIPVLVLPFGPLLLLAAFRWRDPRARLLLVLACMPQMLSFYDQLPLFVGQYRRASIVLALLSWLAYALGPLWIVPLIYVPALLCLVGTDERWIRAGGADR